MDVVTIAEDPATGAIDLRDLERRLVEASGRRGLKVGSEPVRRIVAGVEDHSKGTRATASTLYPMGSVTKTYTAALVRTPHPPPPP